MSVLRTSSSEKSRRRRILEEDSDTEEGDDSATNYGKLAPATVTEGQQKESGSSLSGIGKNSFKLRGKFLYNKKTSSNHSSSQPRTPTKTGPNPTRRTTNTRSSSSSSSSDSSDSSNEFIGNQRRKSNPDYQMFKSKQTKNLSKDSLADSDLDLDSDCSSEVQTSRPKRSPKPTVAERNKKQGIDPFFGNDSDSDLSAVLPTELAIQTTSAHKKRPLTLTTMKQKTTTPNNNSAAKGHTFQLWNKPASAPQLPSATRVVRKPPPQPPRRGSPSTSKQHDNDESDDSSDESFHLRHVTRKCAAMKKQTPSPAVKSPQQSSDIPNYESGQDFEETSSLRSKSGRESPTDSEATAELLAHFHRARRGTNLQEPIGTQSANDQKGPDNDNNVTLEREDGDKMNPNSMEHTAVKCTTKRQEKESIHNYEAFTDKDDVVAPPEPSDIEPNESVSVHIDCDDDNDSAATEELANRLRSRYGLSKVVQKKTAADPPRIQSEKPPICNISFPASEKGWKTQDNRDNLVQIAPSITCPQREQEEFVLPDCDSSSSSSDGECHYQMQKGASAPANLLSCMARNNKSWEGDVLPKYNIISAHPENPYHRKRAVEPLLIPDKRKQLQPPANPYSQNVSAKASETAVTTSSSTDLGSQRQIQIHAGNSRTTTDKAADGHPSSADTCESPKMRHGTQHNQKTTENAYRTPSDEHNLECAFFDEDMAADKRNSFRDGEYSSNHGMPAEEVQDVENLEEEAFFDSPAASRSNKPELVDLSAEHDVVGAVSSEDIVTGAKVPPYSKTVVYEGLRLPGKSPEFNRRSRDFTSSLRSPRRTEPLMEDIEYFSDDDYGATHPRRVTNSHEVSVPMLKVHATASSTNFDPHASAQLPSTSNAQIQQQRPQQHPLRRPTYGAVRPKQWTEEPGKRRRIRDASNSNPFLAQSFRRQASSQAATTRNTVHSGPLVSTNDENIYYRQNLSANTSSQPQWQTFQQYAHQGSVRNDLVGGSGVGAGSYTVQYGGNNEDQNNDVEDEDEIECYVPPPSNRGRRRSTTTPSQSGASSSKKRASQKSTTNMKAKGKSWWSRKRGRGGKSKQGRGSSRGRSSGDKRRSKTGSYMESQADPLLRHMGGADITF